MKKILRVLDHFEEIVLVPAFAVMLIINFGNVLGRFVFHTSWAFTEELCLVSFVYVTFFGASLAVRRHQHLGFDLIYEASSKTIRMILDSIILLVVLALMYVMVRYGIEVGNNQAKFGSTTPALHIPMIYCNACVPIGGICIAMRSIQNYVLNVREFIAYRKENKNK